MDFLINPAAAACVSSPSVRLLLVDAVSQSYTALLVCTCTTWTMHALVSRSLQPAAGIHSHVRMYMYLDIETRSLLASTTAAECQSTALR